MKKNVVSGPSTCTPTSSVCRFRGGAAGGRSAVMSDEYGARH